VDLYRQQGIVQGTYETFAEAGRQHYGGDLTGQVDPDRRARRHGRRAAAGGGDGRRLLLAVECDPDRIDFRLRTRYLDEKADSLDEALAMIDRWTKAGEAKSVGLLGNAAESSPSWCGAACAPTSSPTRPRPRPGQRLPAQGWTVAEWRASARATPRRWKSRPRLDEAVHVRRWSISGTPGVPTLDYGNNIRQVALEEGLENAFAFPGFVPAYIRPLFCRGIGPFRWCALSGDPEDIYKTDAKVKELIPDDMHLHNWLDMARERIAFQGLPARICWVGLGDRHRRAWPSTRWSASGELKAPGRDRARPSRQRLGRLAQPRDRGDEGRLGRGVRLAAAERAGQHRLGRDLGQPAPWRRRRHGLQPACRHGDLLPTAPRRGGGWSGCCGTTRPRA
jgi:urocanate hydratase